MVQILSNYINQIPCCNSTYTSNNFLPHLFYHLDKISKPKCPELIISINMRIKPSQTIHISCHKTIHGLLIMFHYLGNNITPPYVVSRTLHHSFIFYLCHLFHYYEANFVLEKAIDIYGCLVTQFAYYKFCFIKYLAPI